MKLILMLAAALLAAPALASAQNSDVLTGRVIDEAGQPLLGARVEAMSIETEITRSTLTDANGRYMINFPDGGGRYLLRITYLGKADVVRTLVREGDEELLLANVAMSTQAIEIEAVTATARRPQPGQGRAGEQSTELSQELLNRLPLPDLDPNTIAQLAAGVVTTEMDSLTGRPGFSVAGMSELLNQIVLDGMILGESALQIPQEGIRRTSVTTSTFDASRGGFAGGQVSMTSTRGNNRLNGALSYSLDNDAFQLGSAATTNAYSRQVIGAAIGGPLIHNKLFYNLAFGVQRNVNHRFALAANDDIAALRAGVALDSVNRFVGALGRFGVPVNSDGRYNQLRDNVSLQLRTDWNLLQHERQSHTLSLRLNGSNSSEDSTRINALDLTQHGGEVEGDNWAAALTFSSRLGTKWTNALTASFNESWNETLPYLEIPEGRVRVTSELDAVTRGTQTLVFGGNRNMPSDAYRKGVQLSNDLSLLVPIGSQLHRFKLGGTLQQSRSIALSQDNVFGSFVYNSISDLEANRPARFERTLTDDYTRIGSLNAGIYVGDTWRISEPLEVTMGLRWDYVSIDQKPAYNAAVENAFGRRTDIEPTATTFSPRIGFNYRLAASEGQRSAKTISGGIGLFAGQTPTNIFAQASRQTGLADAEQRLVCIGSATPIPDWDLYMNDASAIPSTCADGTSGGVRSSRLPTVSLIHPDQKLPSSLRAEVGYRTRLPLNINANIRYSYARGYGLWGYYDLNLDESRSVRLDRENRPYFGDVTAIVPATGQTTLAASRLYDSFGNVFDIRADRSSSAHQVTTQLSGQLPKGITLGANYTLGFARDEGSGNARLVPTASSPNDVEWAVSSQDRRHTINLTFGKALSPAVEFTAIARLSSGTPFTPMVGSDINGDGLNNDRAFIFDGTSSADTAVSNGMARLIAAAPGRIADCLSEQAGTIAERNSCRNGWSRALDLRASLRPNLPKLERRLTISLDANNLLNGIDQLFNGDNLKGWGENQRVDSRLLEVRGFDAANNAFVYQVNEAFGQNRIGTSATRNPFAIRLTARVAVGGQTFQNNRGFGVPVAMGIGGQGGGRGLGGPGAGAIGGGDGGFGGGMRMGMMGATGTLDPDSIAARALINPVHALIQLSDSLKLEAAQVSQLKLIADSLETGLNALRAKLRAELGNIDLTALQRRRERTPGEPGMDMGGPPAELDRLTRAVQSVNEPARKQITSALAAARRVLTDAQWQQLPLAVRAGAGAQTGGRGGFNAVGLLDRMLANPIPVLLALRDTIGLNAEQVATIENISDALQQKLVKRRADLGKKLDNAAGSDQARLLAEMQPAIQATRAEVTQALRDVEAALTAEQWQRVPDRVKNPFAAGQRQRRNP